MITILHGDNSVASRGALEKLRLANAGKEIIAISGRSIDPSLLVQAVQADSLFGSRKVIILESLLTILGKKSKTTGQITDIVKGAAKEADIILWEDKELSKSQLASLGTAVTVQLFKTPTAVFQFLDAVRPGAARDMIRLFKMSADSNVPEVLFVLIARRIRHLILLKDRIIPTDLADWQRSRLTNQAKLFTMEQLTAMYRTLTEIEYAAKTGGSPFNLKENLEQFLLSL